MDLGGSRRRSSSGPKAGSVWESRMKSDEVKGGIKVFNSATDSVDQNPPPINGTDVKVEVEQRAAKQSPAGKRKTWKSEGLEGAPVKIAGSRSEVCKNLDERCKELSGCDKKTRSESRKVSSESGESRSDEDCREVDVCEEKAITGNVVGPIKNPAPADSGELDEEIKVGNENGDVKEIRDEDDEGKKIVIKQKNEKSNPISPLVKKLQPPPVNHATLHSTPPKINPIADNFPGIQRANSKLQSLVDLVMWRDVAKSAFIFGIGTFGIISSSYTKDLNISFISVISYMGLVYLAAIFLFRSFNSKGSKEMNSENQDYVVGEEEAIWVVKLFLPSVNEFLVKLRALFSGDPATTMKLALLLFILARCGSSITIWKMSKLGFIVVFTVPKICSTYSSQITAYGIFWIRRLEDAWESCSHKKAVGFAIFTLIWNLSSVVARIWAVFMLFVAFKYYQKSSMKDGWVEEKSASGGNSNRQNVIRSDRRFTLTEERKQKKVH